MESKQRFHRRSMRLKGYDYARPGAYFITINCHNKTRLFGEIITDKVVLNEFGLIAFREWVVTPDIRQNVELGPFIIMPDHIHGIIIINCRLNNDYKGDFEYQEINPRDQSKLDSISGMGGCNTPLPDIESNLVRKLISPSQTIGAIIRGYMGTVTSQINKLRNTPNGKVWQRGYNDHIIRSKRSYQEISRYIKNNPKKWTDENL